MRETLYKCQETVDETIERLKVGEPIVVFDLETTGLNKVAERILSCSAIKWQVRDQKFKETDRLDQFINPGMEIDEKVTEINHISNETVKDCPHEEEAAGIIRSFFGEMPMVAGYNSIGFDEPFVNNMYLRVYGEGFVPSLHLDVMRMAKEKLDLPSYKLSDVAHELGADIGLEFHNSIDDVIATSRCMKILMGMYCKQEKKVRRKVAVVTAKRWTRSHINDRIYVYTKPYTKTYYDVYRKVWCSDMEDLDVDDLKGQVFMKSRCANEAELARAIL